jgi:hypothetical protein
VSASPLDLLIGAKAHILPTGHIIIGRMVEFSNLTVCVEVLASNKERSPVAVAQS